jgi:hypothetical protein
MLLNEVQKQSAQLQAQQEENRKLEDRLAALEALLSSQHQRIKRLREVAEPSNPNGVR